MSQVYFIADTHFGHNEISSKFRTNFSSDEEHNETIHENIMSVSGKRNTIWLLGDVVFSPDHFYKLKEYSENFMQVNVVIGNHDPCQAVKYTVMNGINVYGLTKKYKTWLSHCPIHTQEMYRAKANIHGHLHSGVVRKCFNPAYDVNQEVDNKYLCVSCEQINYMPISLIEVREIFNNRGIEV